MRRLVGALALVVVGWFAVWGFLTLRHETLSKHEPIPPGSRLELVFHADNHGGHPSHSLTDMTEAQLAVCRLEVATDLVGDMEPLGRDRFRAVFSPALDESDRKQFRGCIEDWEIDHLRIDVEQLRDL
jgi:hypothetical protein